MPPTTILAINAGSSSVKVSAYTIPSNYAFPSQDQHQPPQDPTLLATAEVTNITAAPASLKYTRGSHSSSGHELQGVEGQAAAFRAVMNTLYNDPGLPQLKKKEDIHYICHRIVHGGDFEQVTRLNADTMHKLDSLTDLAPLHNTVGLQIVRLVHGELPHASNFAYFDSSFHTTIPEHIRTYAISQEKARRNGLRKYGFHGISYAFITKAVAAHLGKRVQDTNIIALHLGSGASACAIRRGQSLDTSMGLTPVSGLPGGTRSGDVDPSLVFHYTNDAGGLSNSSTKEMHITTAEEILNKEAGFKALTGTSDFGKISAAVDTHPECKLAVDLFVDRVIGFIGSYYLKMGGRVDALVLAGGIGEKGEMIREKILNHCLCLGFQIDTWRNRHLDEGGEGKTVVEISIETSKQKVLVVRTDEQLEMARGCIEEVGKERAGQ